MPIVSCPSCGGTDDLQGQRSHGGVVVTCGACGHSWQRDLAPTCTRCGSTDLVAVPTTTLEEAGRGEQRTPAGIRDVYRCRDCGVRDATSSSPVPDPDWQRRPTTAVRSHRVRDDADEAPAGPRAAADSRRVESAFGLFAPGQVIGGRWRLATMLRWSSTGSLWLATADDDRRVLFKLVHPRLTSDRRRTGLYASAAHAATEVRHRHLLPVLDVKVLDGHVLVVAAAVEGSVLHATSRLEPASLSRVAAGVADALAAMHGHDVAHLDVRPGKILVGSDGHARLVDLGSGRARAAQRTRVAGDERLSFQAPEQIVAGEHGPAADVYSLGLSLWTLAGGDLQRMGVNAAAQGSYRLTHNVPALDPATSRLPARITDAIAAATRRPPAQRQSAAELAERLRDDAPSA